MVCIGCLLKGLVLPKSNSHVFAADRNNFCFNQALEVLPCIRNPKPLAQILGLGVNCSGARPRASEQFDKCAAQQSTALKFVDPTVVIKFGTEPR